LSNICIVTPPHYQSETFIRAHEELLSGEKKVLTGKFPNYYYRDHHLVTQYNRHNRFRRLLKLLPQVLYERVVPRGGHETQAAKSSLQEFFEEESVDVILAEYGMTGADITPIAKRNNIPLVVHFHGHDAYNRNYLKDYESRFEAMFEYAATVISVSTSMTEQLLKLGAKPGQIQLNPYGPREQFFELNPDYRKPQLIAIGRFVDMKAPYITLAAFHQALQSCPDARLIMVGDGDLREACVNLAEGWGISNHVEFPGTLDHEQTRELLEGSRAFVQHSVQQTNGVCEGTPVAILEAGASALPVIATRHAGISQAVIHESTGLLVEERDLKGMARHMTQILQNENQARTFGHNARKHIQEHFSIDRHLSKLQSIIESAASSRK
jgi:glycosyltransferase involved in cell wall biosynthesis